MAGRPCKICASSSASDRVKEAIAQGASDQQIADMLGPSFSRAGVNRHRLEHLAAPARVALEAIEKGRTVRDRRERLVREAADGDALAVLSLGSIAADLARIFGRLDGAAESASDGGQHSGHAALAAQLLRGLELRSRLGGHDRPAPSAGDRQPFAVNIHFSTETVSITPVAQSGPDRVLDVGNPLVEDLQEIGAGGTD